jgi:hypothetical protein
VTDSQTRTVASPAAAAFLGSPKVVAERTPAAPDSDSATRQTVERMTDYIRGAIADPEVRRCTEYAWRKFGMNLAAPAMKAWAVFWWVKHSVKLRMDEATMFRVGLQDEQDLLIDPRVLVRMKDPAEDCDGFTMLGAAMLSILGIPVYIVTVAADPNDRGRWSHVFPIAVLPGGVVPLDMSHGVGPGARFMVPREQIYRWQAWDLEGRPADVKLSPYRGLHNYVRRGAGMGRRRGVGAAIDPETGLPFDTLPADTTSQGWIDFSGAPVPPPSGPSPWPQALTAIAADTAGVLTRFFAPPAYQQTVRDPVTGALISQTIARGPASPGTAMLSPVGNVLGSPLLWLGGGLLAVIAMTRSRTR